MYQKLYITILFTLSLLQFCDLKKTDDTCKTCRDIVNNFKKGLDKTAKNHFGGGDTAWEESRLGSYARSETRLLEILEDVCEGTGKESRCHAIVEEYEEKIEEYWFNKHNEIDDLEKYLCIETITVCCPEGTFGKECKSCPGGSEKPCNGHGSCKGSGLRSGDGSCECDSEYTGDLCDECSETHYDSGNNTCSKCDDSCESSCSDGTNKGCDGCKDGYLQNEEQACIDKNECEEDDVCVEGKFCINTKGSYRCEDCDPACEGGCTGTGRRSCNKCQPGWKEIAGAKGCEDVNECEETASVCDIGSYCVNSEGSHDCQQCHSSCSTDDGCTGEGPTQCLACSPGWEMGEKGCVDVDECKVNNIKCDHGQVCVNKEGGDGCEACDPSCNECVGTGPKSCLNCRDGFLLKDSQCEDINECASNPCDKKTENCQNQLGTYTCKCKKGWVRTKQGKCKKKSKSNEKKKKGTKKAKSQTWEEQLNDDILSGKAFLTEEHIRMFGLAHSVFFALVLILFKYGRYYVLAAVYAVAMSYVYVKHGKNFFY